MRSAILITFAVFVALAIGISSGYAIEKAAFGTPAREFMPNGNDEAGKEVLRRGIVHSVDSTNKTITFDSIDLFDSNATTWMLISFDNSTIVISQTDGGKIDTILPASSPAALAEIKEGVTISVPIPRRAGPLRVAFIYVFEDKI